MEKPNKFSSNFITNTWSITTRAVAAIAFAIVVKVALLTVETYVSVNWIRTHGGIYCHYYM